LLRFAGVGAAAVRRQLDRGRPEACRDNDLAEVMNPIRPGTDAGRDEGKEMKEDVNEKARKKMPMRDAMK
jgi:hypothetical protein